MGKTFLLDRLAKACAELGKPVYRWTGHYLEQGYSFGALDDFLDSIQLRRPAEARTTRQLILDRLGAEQAVLLVDDAQWIDAESLRVLVGVAERAPARGIGLVVAHRPADGEEIAVLDDILSRSQPILQLAPLAADEVGKRVGANLGCDLEPAVVDALMARTEGVPLYVDRLTEAWVEAGVIENGALVRDPGALPAVAAQLVFTKLAQLGTPARLIVTGLTVGTSLNDELLGALFGLSVEEMRSTVTAMRNAGLMSPTRPVLLPMVGEAVDALTPLLTQRDLHFRLAKILLGRGAPVATVAEHLVAAEAKGTEVADLLMQAGDQSLADAPEMALDWYGEAVAAGADPAVLGVRRAEAAAAAGALEEALARADQVLELQDPPDGDRRRAMAVIAGVLPSRGLWRRSSEVYESISTLEPGPEAFYAVVGLIATGDLERARSNLKNAEEALGAAPLFTHLAALTARGCLETLGDDPMKSIGYLMEAAELLEAGKRAVSVPDTPHALGALAAIAAVEFPVAEHLLERAIASSAGGVAFAARHRLLLGWVGMRTGRWAMAETALDSVMKSSPLLSLRDQLTASALEVGLARRQSDHDRLGTAWSKASIVLRRHPADLFCSEMIGDLCSAQRRGLAASRLSEVEQLCASMGLPRLWLVAIRWHALQAAISFNDSGDIEACAKDLESLEPASPNAAILIEAGAVWTDALAGRVDPQAIRTTAANLQQIGMGWEASRLAGSAASRANDPAVSHSLLENARELTATLPTRDQGAVASFTALSERERQVASLVVGGLTHKEIGAHLYISPKTVEHHVARIRQRLGAGSRAELLSELRSILAKT